MSYRGTLKAPGEEKDMNIKSKRFVIFLIVTAFIGVMITTLTYVLATINYCRPDFETTSWSIWTSIGVIGITAFTAFPMVYVMISAQWVEIYQPWGKLMRQELHWL